MRFEYFDGREPASNFYMPVPKCLHLDPELRKISCEARYLYAIMLDKMKYAAKKGQVDKEGRTYIYYKWQDISEDIGKGRNTVFKLLEELDVATGVGLIERVIMGQGRQSRIYVMRIVEAEQEYVPDEYEAEDNVQKFKNRDSEEKIEVSESQKVNFKNVKNRDSRVPNSNTQEVYDLGRINKNNINKNNYNKNLIHIYPSNTMVSQMDGMRLDDETATRLYVREDIGTDAICNAYPHWESKVRGLEDLIVDVLTSKRRKITISGEERELNVVKGRFMKLNRFQLETVIENWSKLKKAPQNSRAYLLAMLFNVSGTADMQFEAECNEGAQSNYQHVAVNNNNTDYDELMEG